MIRHIVMWKLKETEQPCEKRTNALMIKEKLEALKGKIEGLVEIEVGIDINIEGNDDVVLNAVVTDKKALDFYQQHPLHQAVLPHVKAVVVSRHAVDYEF